MATRIDQRLIERLKSNLGLSQSAVYARIAQKARERALETHLAALCVARDAGINITRFATPADLATLRGTMPQNGTVSPTGGNAQPTTRANPGRTAGKGKRKSSHKKGNSVFVVHGRNDKLRKAMFQFLRTTGVQPIEWSKALQLSGSASPYVGEILDAAFKKAQAVVVLLTPDDEARLRPEFQRPKDPPYERRLMNQARPNVLFEAGMAFGTHPAQTVIVEVGELRPFSDTFGRHVVHLTNDTTSRQELMIKLKNAGCEVDFAGSDWQTEGEFSL